MKQTDKLIAWQRTVAHMHGRRKAEGFLGFLAECGKVLSLEISFYESLPRLANLTVPFLGDWISIDLFFGDGWVRNVARKSSIDLDQEHARQLERIFRPYTQLGYSGTPKAILAKNPAFYPNDRQITEPANMILAELGVNSYLVIPLKLPQGRIGAVTILSMVKSLKEESRQYGPAELAVGEELGRRVSLAVERSILYQEGWRLKKEIFANVNQVSN